MQKSNPTHFHHFRKSEASSSPTLSFLTPRQQQQVENNKIFNHQNPHMSLTTKHFNPLHSHAATKQVTSLNSHFSFLTQAQPSQHYLPTNINSTNWNTCMRNQAKPSLLLISG
ncbi:hypothetical protein QL285_069587 [Trifolium repens]|jgi:hypothetical protein|nr:hypothetical protein QL285_069587 [Trifolium repens]